MTIPVHRNALSAWEALRIDGRLDMDDRDDDLIGKLKDALDPRAPDLASALASATTDEFLSALFGAIQPFVAMFRDILAFFEKAGAREGQSQWRISVGDQFLDLRQFEEFLEHWNAIDAELEVPALDRRHAFILNKARADIGGYDYLVDGMAYGKKAETGIDDVDDWLADYDAGRYAPFPASLMPSNFPAGLSDAAALVLAAVTILRRRGLSRQEVLDEHRARGYKSVDDDALHPWTVAQSETDYWLRSHVGYLANILRQPSADIETLAALTAAKLAPFPRRRVPGKIETKEIERLLSLPVWRQRYETYGVWIATQIASSLDGHELVIHSSNGELKFAFGTARIADVVTTRPMLSLFAERRVALVDPVGKSRTAAVQPDFSMWSGQDSFSDCVLVVEVKHYKKRARRNFEEALTDYARAHPRAKVVLVNYGPVGDAFDTLPLEIAERCVMIGPLTPETYATLGDFRKLVSELVGPPMPVANDSGKAIADRIIALDVSGSMRTYLASAEFATLLEQARVGNATFAMIDQGVRAIMLAHDVGPWLTNNDLGSATSLADPVGELLGKHAAIIVITDEDGIASLGSLRCERVDSPLAHNGKVIFAQVTL